MTNELTQGLYRQWLVQQIKPLTDMDHTFFEMYKIVHDVPFTWTIPNDDNRVVDGLKLREEFLASVPAAKKKSFSSMPCSVLEVIVSLSRHMAFVSDDSAEHCAQLLARNLGLHLWPDPLGPRAERAIEEALWMFLSRQYNSDGTGGLFPLAFPPSDQRGVELWYQMNTWVEENEGP